MAKKKNDYFQLLEQQIGFCVQASELLEEILHHADENNIQEYKERMHEIEHMADDVHHDILTRLSAEFITPIDQEDILRLVQIIDDITDALDEVVMELYMFCIRRIPEAAPAISSHVNRCVKALHAAAGELKNFKKPEKLREQLIEVNTIESEADAVYTEAIHTLFRTETDCKALIGAKEIYDSLEHCCDLCEHAADVIDQIIIKNT